LSEAFLLAAVFLSPLAAGGFRPGGSAALLALTGVAALLILAQALFVERRLRWTRSAMTLPAIVFLAIGGASVFVSVNRHATYLEFGRVLVGALAFFVLVTLPPDRRRATRVVVAVVAGSMWVGVAGWREYLSLVRAGDATWRIFGTFYNPNMLAGFLAMVLPVAASLYLMVRRREERLLAAFSGVVLLGPLVLTGSRGGWLALLAGAFIYVLLAPWGRGEGRGRLRWMGGIAVLLVVIAAAWLAPPVRGRLLSSFGAQSSSGMFRYLTWQGTLHMIAAHPWLGVGWGGFQSAFPQYQVAGFTRMAHQNYLQLAAEGGIACLLAFLGFLVAFYRTAARRLVDGMSRPLVVAAVAGMTAFAVHSLLDFGWYIGATALLVWTLAGLVAASGDPPIGERPCGGPLAKRGLWFVLAAAFIGVFAVLAVRAHVAEGHVARALLAESEGDRWAAVAEYRMAARLDPGNGAYHRQLARLLGPDREGMAEIGRALALEPTNGLGYALRARLDTMRGDTAAAVRDFETALRLSPQLLSAYLDLGILYRREGKLTQSARTYERMVEIERGPANRYRAIDRTVDVEYAFAHYYLGRLRGWDLPDPEPPSARLARAEDEFLQASRVLGAYDGRSQSLEQSQENIGMATQDWTEDVTALRAKIEWMLGRVAAERGDAATAEGHRRRAEELAPDVEAQVRQEDRQVLSP
jgi:putative inorganic carbon (HCO3(-)) transporter